MDCSVNTVQENINLNYKLYPNPVNDVLRIENPSQTITEIRVLDILGKIIYENKEVHQTPNISIDFSDVRKGIYVVELVNNQNASARYKLMKL